jgi:RimJ/RimL family protein N-acetyltransferase
LIKAMIESTTHKNLFEGKLVRLIAPDIELMSKSFSRWSRDSEFSRLLNSGVSFPISSKAMQALIEKQTEKDPPDFFWFAIQTIQDNRLIGDIGLDGVRWNHRDTFVGIGLGERKDWGKGYGTDAMRIILRYAFLELNLQRVSLNVFAYNTRAIRSYEKTGFTHEGRIRQYLNRAGQRWDILYMGILRQEWENRYL